MRCTSDPMCPYGAVGNRRQGELIRSLTSDAGTDRVHLSQIVKAVIREMGGVQIL